MVLVHLDERQALAKGIFCGPSTWPMLPQLPVLPGFALCVQGSVQVESAAKTKQGATFKVIVSKATQRRILPSLRALFPASAPQRQQEVATHRVFELEAF